jgi:2-dehydropantoate 2-reductase
VENIAEIPPAERQCDLAVLTVKVYDTAESVQALASGLSQRPPLLILQNGVGGEELARQSWGDGEIVSGVITLPVSVLAPAYFRLEMTRGGMGLAPTQPGQCVDKWAECLVAAGFRVVTHSDYRAMKWSKLLLNIQANAIPAILDMRPGTVFSDPTLFALERSAFLEALAVMRAQHLRSVGFPNYPVSLLAWAWRTLPDPLLRPALKRLVATGRGDKPPSLQIGLAGGQQRSEVLYLNGAVVAEALRLGLHAPVNQVILDTLMGIATGEIPWDDFRHQPQKLVAAVRAGKGQQPCNG